MIETFEYIKIRLTAMAKTERGASAVEYGLLVALIAIIIIVAVSLLGSNLSRHLQQDRQQHRQLTSVFTALAATPLGVAASVISGPARGLHFFAEQFPQVVNTTTGRSSQLGQTATPRPSRSQP